MTEAIKNQVDAAFRIRRAVCIISEKRPSIERSTIDQFLRFISPSMVSANGVGFPRTCRRHPLNDERTREGGSRALVLYFHIGNAILGFYEYLKIEANVARVEPEVLDAQLSEALDKLNARIDLLEGIARLGLDASNVIGDAMSGYTLSLPQSAETDDVPTVESLS